MQISRHYTSPGCDAFDAVSWTRRSSRITAMDGSTVFEMEDVEVPASWSQLATDIMVSKYFRQTGVPQVDASGQPVRDDEGKVVTGPERSVRQVVHRLAGCWRHWGQTHGYFDTDADAQAFYDEVCHMLLNQMAAPNSPQWFNTGLHFAYGINGPAQGHFYADPDTGQARASEDAYSRPQPHACFIQDVDDELLGEDGIMGLWQREARLFKYGSGTGTNFSALRGEGEPLSGGGRSSGLMSFLRIGDRAAAAIKSGGTTRRAAKMVCLDLDHPDIEAFVDWKAREELKVAAMVEGMKHLSPEHRDLADQMGLSLDYDFNGEAYESVSGQNSNNSVRVPDAFFAALDAGSPWKLTRRTDGGVAKELCANQLWDRICHAAWRCADPGVQFDTTINQWHTCPESGRINASNPCSEFMFLDNTACNLASINLLTFYDAKTQAFDLAGFEHAVRLWTVVLEISVLMAQYPSRAIAQRSHDFRPLGLGFANLGALLMRLGVPYDSDRGRAIAGAITALMTGRSYAVSAQLAAGLGAFGKYDDNREAMLRVLRNHRRAAYGVPRDAQAADHLLGDYEGLSIRPCPLDAQALWGEGDAGATPGVASLANAKQLVEAARSAWDQALELGQQHGFRNAQVTVLAPTGTIGLLMDCDTTGVEPDFALIKYKKLSGGGYFKIGNQSVKPALCALGYTEVQIRDILHYMIGTLSLDVPMGEGAEDADGQSFWGWLSEQGFTASDLTKIKESLPGAFDLSQALSPSGLSPQTLENLGLDADGLDSGSALLQALGLGPAEVARLHTVICGTQMLEGAPHLRAEHLPVFDCAAACGPRGTRCIAPSGHIRMMAAAQPFITGAISKTINLPNSATVEDILGAYRLSWELGLKGTALYRDGCKLSQPLNSQAQQEEPVEDSSREAEAFEESPAPAVVIPETVVERPLRRRLPDTRRSITHKFAVGGHEGYLTAGLYDDGQPGELFITMAKEGSTVGGLMDSLGTAISVSLQYGVPVESLIRKFTHQRFEPAGFTHNPDIPMAKSLVDYIFRWFGMEFVPGYRESNSPQHQGKRKSRQDKPHDSAPENISTRDHAPDAQAASKKPGTTHAAESQAAESLALAMHQLQDDAPACAVCGTITVRNGTCYRCLNCGNSMGCS